MGYLETVKIKCLLNGKMKLLIQKTKLLFIIVLLVVIKNILIKTI